MVAEALRYLRSQADGRPPVGDAFAVSAGRSSPSVGSVAVLSATAEIEAGRYDCVLVLAVEQERNVPGADAPKHLGAAAWIGHEGQDAKFMWPYMFSQLADEYDRRYGLNDAHLHAIAGDDRDNPVVEGRLRRTDCAQVTDGVAGVLLVSDRYRAERLGGKPLARIAGLGAWRRRAAAAAQARPQPGAALRLPARPSGRRRRLPAGGDP